MREKRCDGFARMVPKWARWSTKARKDTIEGEDGGGVLATLFTPFTLNALQLRNRVVMSPMCQYSVWAEDGVLNEWHYVHYISRAVGGVGLVMVEMTDVHPDGRITVHDSGIWDDRHIQALARIGEGVHQYGAKFGVQIAHAGRKAESESLKLVGPSAIPFDATRRTPKALSTGEVEGLVEAFAAGARRALSAGVDCIELHGAHGYLINQFMSPLSNHRGDRYGEPTRFPLEVIAAVKSVMPSDMPLFMRVSAVEYSPEGYTFDQLVEMCRAFGAAGVDLFDVSSGGNAPVVPPHIYPGYHVPYASEIKRRLHMPVMGVGILEDYRLAESVVAEGRVDLVAIGRGLLRDPYWANSAAVALGEKALIPKEYYRAFPHARPDLNN